MWNKRAQDNFDIYLLCKINKCIAGLHRKMTSII